MRLCIRHVLPASAGGDSDPAQFRSSRDLSKIHRAIDSCSTSAQGAAQEEGYKAANCCSISAISALLKRRLRIAHGHRCLAVSYGYSGATWTGISDISGAQISEDVARRCRSIQKLRIEVFVTTRSVSRFRKVRSPAKNADADACGFRVSPQCFGHRLSVFSDQSDLTCWGGGKDRRRGVLIPSDYA